MAVLKDENAQTWRVVYRYTDWKGERKQTQKRGFKTKREALAWEREELCKRSGKLDMTFQSFIDCYFADAKNRIEPNTWDTKEHISTGQRVKQVTILLSGIKNKRLYAKIYHRQPNSRGKQICAVFFGKCA